MNSKPDIKQPSLKSLPIKTPGDLSRSTAESLKQCLEDYQALVRHVMSALNFFLDNVTTKFESAVQIREVERQAYADILELFRFNHYDVRLELQDFERKEVGVFQRIEALFASGPRPKSETLGFKPPGSSTALPRLKLAEMDDLIAKNRKLNKKNARLTKVVRDLHLKYRDLLKQLEASHNRPAERRRESQEALYSKAFHPDREVAGESEVVDRARSVNDVDRRNSRTPGFATKSFQFLENEHGPSTYAFNPANENRSRQLSTGPTGRRQTFGYNQWPAEDLSDNASFKEDISRQNDEIDLLNREIGVLKKELREKNKEKALIIEKYEHSIKQEKESAHRMIHTLRQNLQFKEQKESELLSVNDFTFNGSERKSASPVRLDDLNNSRLADQLEKRKRTLNTLKSSLDVLLKEKQGLQQNVGLKNKEIAELQKQISFLEDSNQKYYRDLSELELANSQLTTKFLGAVERENVLIKKYNQLLSKVRAYEKYIESINQEKK